MRGDPLHNETAKAAATRHGLRARLVALEKRIRRNGVTTFADVYAVTDDGRELIIEVEMRVCRQAVLNAVKALRVGVDEVEIVTPTRQVGRSILGRLRQALLMEDWHRVRFQLCGYYLFGNELRIIPAHKCEPAGTAESNPPPGSKGDA